MSEAKAFSPEQRSDLLVAMGVPIPDRFNLPLLRSYEALVCQVEAALCQVEATLVEVERERNALRTIVDWHYSPAGLARVAETDLRKLSPRRRQVIKAMRALRDSGALVADEVPEEEEG